MNQQGFNGNFLELEPARVEDIELPEDREAHIQATLKSKSINKGGGLFKDGIHGANDGILIKAGKRHIEIENK